MNDDLKKISTIFSNFLKAQYPTIKVSSTMPVSIRIPEVSPRGIGLEYSVVAMVSNLAIFI